MLAEEVSQICEFIEKVDSVEKEIEDKLQSLSEPSIDALEKAYNADSDSASVADHATYIQTIVDRAREFTENRQFYHLNQATEHALIEIRKFHDLQHSKGHFLPKSVYISLRLFLENHEKSLSALRIGVETLRSITQYNDFSKTDKLAIWAEGLEHFGDALEDNVPFFDFNTLEGLEPLLHEVIQQAKKKSKNLKSRENKKEGFRVRIRNAAGFLLRLIESLREESELEDQEILSAISTANHPAFFED